MTVEILRRRRVRTAASSASRHVEQHRRSAQTLRNVALIHPNTWRLTTSSAPPNHPCVRLNLLHRHNMGVNLGETVLLGETSRVAPALNASLHCDAAAWSSHSTRRPQPTGLTTARPVLCLSPRRAPPCSSGARPSRPAALAGRPVAAREAAPRWPRWRWRRRSLCPSW